MQEYPKSPKAPMMRRMLVPVTAAALALAACSQPAEKEAAESAAVEAMASSDVASGAAAAPGADPSVAPGVAFAYRFNFELADDNVSQAQDRHVTACERLTTARCRVTGLRYDQEDGGPVRASLSFLLDPTLARSFARDAVDSVRELDGTLLDSSVGGEDVGTGITASQQSSAAMGGDLTRIEARLRQPGLSAGESRDLSAQAENLRGELRNAEQGRRGGEARLASTPVEFAYRGTTGVAGFDRSRPFASAFSASTDSFGTAAAFVLMLVGLLLPWALMVGGLVLAVRWLRGRLNSRASNRAATADVGTM